MRGKGRPPDKESRKFMRELRNPKVLRALLADIRRKTPSSPSPLRIMEVCGTHTMAIHRFGLKAPLEEAGIRMISGPGCPVCITPNAVHDAAIGLVTREENMILATFGDMTRVPARRGSLQTAVPARNSRIQIVYSPDQALEAARKEPRKEVVFFGAGFETTTPAIALTVKKAHEENIRNYSVLAALWLIPPAIRAILEAGEIALSGFLYPGHVSAIIGLDPYRFVPAEYGLPGAVAGFEPADILLGIRSVLEQLAGGTPGVSLEYSRAVASEGNAAARNLMREILEPKDAVWRGLGLIRGSALQIKKKYAAFDAETKHGLKIRGKDADVPGCRCGEVLRGLITPEDCRLFGRKCRPESPIGPCMVSMEGACLVHHKYAPKKGLANEKN